MNRAHVFLALFACCLIYCGCSKPPHIHAGGPNEELGPIVEEVRLADTISPSFTHALQLEAVTGSGFRYPSGDQASYFTYEADAREVLGAVSRLAFPMRDRTADVSYHVVARDEWDALRHSVGEYEMSGAAFFWDVDPVQYDIYASAKNDHHLLLVERESGRIYHRIYRRS